MHADYTFMGNKNGTGSKLGCMQFQTHDSSQNVATIDSNHTDKHLHTTDTIQFLGNKNGIGTKLGDMSVVSLSGNHADNATDDSQLPQQVDFISDNLVYTNTRITKIPSHVYGSRYQSIDYKNCLYQNEKKFGFLPLNDLMVYTGHDVIWGDVPNILQAHAHVRQSGVPNFMSCRIPVQTQLKVQAWKKYLNSYWDRQLIDLTIRLPFRL